MMIRILRKTKKRQRKIEQISASPWTANLFPLCPPFFFWIGLVRLHDSVRVDGWWAVPFLPSQWARRVGETVPGPSVVLLFLHH